MEHQKKEGSSNDTSRLSRKRPSDNQIEEETGGSVSKVNRLANKVTQTRENPSPKVLGTDSDNQKLPKDHSSSSEQAPALGLTLSEEESGLEYLHQNPGHSGASNLPAQKSERHETSKQELKGRPDPPEVTSSSSSDSLSSQMETCVPDVELPMELGTDSDTEVTPEPMDFSPPRLGQARDTVPRSTTVNDPETDSLGNPSPPPQDPGPSRGAQEDDAHYDGITYIKLKVSAKVEVLISAKAADDTSSDSSSDSDSD